MPIIKRPPPRTNDVPRGWDGNREEVQNWHVPVRGVKEIAEAVCGFTSSGIEPSKAPKHEAWVKENIEGGKTRILDMLKVNTKSRRNYYVNKVQAAKNAFAALDPADPKRPQAQIDLTQLQAEQTAENARVDALDLELATFRWPDSTDKALLLKFTGQPGAMNSTGFTFAPGFVMTAEHVVAGLVGLKALHPVYFNWAYQMSKPVLPIGKAYNDPKAIGIPKGDSKFEIKRFVLRTVKAPPAKAQNVSRIKDNDAAIVELEEDKRYEWPEKVLKIADKVPLAIPARDVYAIGHSHGLPLKCISWDGRNTSTKPSIKAGPAVGQDRHEHPCIAIDLDIFGANSGGPVFDALTGEVIAICRQISLLGLYVPNIAAQCDLYDDAVAWLKKVNPTTVIAPSELDDWKVRCATYLNFVHDASEKRFELGHVDPGSNAVLEGLHFNRVDLFSPFTKPVADFMKASPDRILECTMSIDISPVRLISRVSSIEPTIHVTGNQELLCGASPKDVSTTGMGLEATFRWGRLCVEPKDVRSVFIPSGFVGNGISADFPDRLFALPGGFAAWEKVTFICAGLPLNVSAKGRLSVVACYDQNNEDNSVDFSCELAFDLVPGKQGHYEALIGEHVLKRIPLHMKGNPWRGPEATTMYHFGRRGRASAYDP